MGFLDSGGLAHFWAKVKTALSAKQDKLTGTAGQVVGFDAQGQAVAQDHCGFPSGGIINGNSQPHSNMPPYYALCYIMKL